jgi:sulfite reductase (ferredoxin)
LLEALARVGLNTMSACGDVTRNVTGCPVAGVDADEICDASPLALEAVAHAGGQCRFLQSAAQIQDLDRRMPRVVPVSGDQRHWLDRDTRLLRGTPEVGFSLRVAGGLSTEPYLGARLNAFVRWNQVLPAIKGIAELFRDSEVLREHRERAR